jgi:hypothetical protein
MGIVSNQRKSMESTLSAKNIEDVASNVDKPIENIEPTKTNFISKNKKVLIIGGVGLLVFIGVFAFLRRKK